LYHAKTALINANFTFACLI